MVHFATRSQTTIIPLGGTMEAPTHPAVSDDTAAAQVKTFIDKGQFRKARELAEDIEREAGADPDGPELDAAYWYQYMLACHLTGRGGDLQRFRATVSAGFSPTMMVDLQRDTILYMIRMGRAEQAQYLIDELQSKSSSIGDNHWLASVMTQGRVHYALRNFEEAFSCFEEAALGWLNLGNSADKQWERNNMFWLYKVTTISGKRSTSLAVLHLTQPRIESLVSNDPSRMRRITVWFGDHFGGSGIRTLDTLQSLWFRLPRISR